MTRMKVKQEYVIGGGGGSREKLVWYGESR